MSSASRRSLCSQSFRQPSVGGTEVAPEVQWDISRTRDDPSGRASIWQRRLRLRRDCPSANAIWGITAKRNTPPRRTCASNSAHAVMRHFGRPSSSSDCLIANWWPQSRAVKNGQAHQHGERIWLRRTRTLPNRFLSSGKKQSDSSEENTDHPRFPGQRL